MKRTREEPEIRKEHFDEACYIAYAKSQYKLGRILKLGL